jgi:hypothetical protein
MSCKTCSDLQLDIELAAREFSRAIQESRVAIHEIAGVASANRIEEAERTLRVATQILKMHQEHCGSTRASRSAGI